ncbi:hypothetical protein K470DRAFT_225993 [Piedraia hortae CBS 480.64]|uniref:Rad60/SUMO-like domain-containing protein n=1 Tax=Piedraia hortae CBS 480.64 TaxID=1314780 RepID=A0A6A7C7L4_9PEZI|nr:hypothetical protein K470DRAFT_225993 [Piedraia hortae CBS 480.64]
MSLFKRPDWAKNSSTPTRENIFSHSTTYAEIIAEEHRKKRERDKEKAMQNGEKKVTPQPPTPEGDVMPPLEAFDRHVAQNGVASQTPGKTQTVTTVVESDDDDIQIVAQVQKVQRDGTKRRRITPNGAESLPKPVLRAHTTYKPIAPKAAPERPSDRSSSPVRKVPPPLPVIHAKPKVEEPKVPQSDSDSDPDIAALARRARMRRSVATSQTPDASRRDTVPTVSLLISSPIEGTKPIIVTRKVTQNLQEVRLAWCKRQACLRVGFNEIFLIHGMRRVHDITTCRNLGLEVGQNGELRMKGRDDGEVGQIALRAVTQEIFEELQRESLKPRPTQEEPEGEPEPDPEAGNNFRISLRFKTVREPYKLRVRPVTKISKIIDVTRQHFNVPEEQTLILEADGEALNPNSIVGETELEDEDCIDVYTE